MKRFAPLLALLIGACSESSTSKTPESCPAGSKQCGSACVSIDLPEFGCTAIGCDPCPVPGHGRAICVQGSCAMTCDEGRADCDHQSGNGCETDLRSSLTDCGSCGNSCESAHAESSCAAGKCVVSTCEGTWKDCNAQASDGCEANTDDNPSHCGACGKACEQGEVCYQAQCLRNADVLAWLETQKGGWCLDDYKKLINLCGKVSVCHYTLCGDLDTDPAGSDTCYDDFQHEHEKAVPFCCDTRFLKQYPDGIAIDIGFHYDGLSTGLVLDLGGDVEAKRLSIGIAEEGKLWLTAGWPETALEATLTAGSYLVSYYVSQSRSALFVNGLLVAEGQGAAAVLELATDHGPGMVIGSRVSYWWESTSKRLRLAPFLFHLRQRAPQEPWTLQDATAEGPDTLLLFGNQGVSGNAWTAAVGPQTAYAITIDPTATEPVWIADAMTQCF